MSSLLLSFCDLVGSLFSPLMCNVFDYLIVTPSPIFPPFFPSFSLRSEALALSLLFQLDINRFRDLPKSRLMIAAVDTFTTILLALHLATFHNHECPDSCLLWSLSSTFDFVNDSRRRSVLHQPPSSLAFTEIAVQGHALDGCIEAIPLVYRRIASKRRLRLTIWHFASQIENGGG
jgi:hypothetical protein